MNAIRIPRRFADDHAERDLPTPTLTPAGARHYMVNADDPALPELLADARHYSDPDVFSAGPDEYSDISIGLRSSARATVAALQSLNR